eukprot:TRINITY_DN180720_c0_g1_i1.p2 TRINITY_DN180720_c0_g1~~TRINITY_DN180720_c0_g1_i1.p2  ORF type:complete len:114 (+),score=5.59 TRINITY_DN180720_c0_g1_i1:2-343(+)
MFGQSWKLPAPQMTVLEVWAHTKKLRKQLLLLSNICGCDHENTWATIGANQMQYKLETRELLIEMMYSRFPKLTAILQDLYQRGKPSPSWLITGFQSGVGLLQIFPNFEGSFL